MKSGRNFEDGVDVERENRGDEQTQNADATVAEQAGVDQLSEVFNVVDGGEFRDIAHYRGTDPEIEQAVIAGNGKNQNPDTGGGVAQLVQDERVQRSEEHTSELQSLRHLVCR